MANIKAIETRYKGYRFRSRLEARWAVFFDANKTPWEYEKEGFNLPSGKYLPDFWLPRQRVWLEIKPMRPTDREMSLVKELRLADTSEVIGNSHHWCTFLFGNFADHCVLGFNGTRWSGATEDGPNSIVHMTSCRECFQLVFAENDLADMENGWFGHCFNCGTSNVYQYHPTDSRYRSLISPIVRDAYEKGRSARFEHGESP